MFQPIYFPLANAALYRNYQLSRLGIQLLNLHSQGFPIAPTFAITPEALSNVLHKNPETQSALLWLYHSQLNNDFVSIYFQDKHSQIDCTYTNIIGDANFLDSLFEIAQKCDNHPILVQAAPQSEHSGIAWTKNQESGNKNQIEIWSTPGVFPADRVTTFYRTLVDHRTNQIVEHNHHVKIKGWRRAIDNYETLSQQPQPNPPSNELIIDLSQLTIKLKRYFFADQKTNWMIKNNILLIQSIKPENSDEDSESATNQIGFGTPFIPGYVQGLATSLPDLENEGFSNLHKILITKTLSKEHIPLLHRFTGIIVQGQLTDPQVITWLLTYKTPTITHANLTQFSLIKKRPIILDAKKGKVFSETKSNLHQQAKVTSNPVYCLTSYADALPSAVITNSDGLVLSSNHWYTSLKIHPLQLTKEHKNLFASMQYQQILTAHHYFQSNFFYFFSSLDGSSRSHLQFGHASEKFETNPALGLRGTGYLLENPELIALETKGLALAFSKFTATRTANSVKVVLPFVQSTSDAQLFSSTVKLLHPDLPLEYWLHVANFASLVQLCSSSNEKANGIILDLNYLLASWHGLDPQSPTQQQIPNLPASSFWPQLQSLLAKNHSPIAFLYRDLSLNINPLLQSFKPAFIITTQKQLRAARIH